MRTGEKIILLAAVAVLGLTGCGNGAQPQETQEKIEIVCASFPEYDWTRQIIGENNKDISLTLIADNGMDIHNYQPSVEDMVKIDGCDLLIYNGGTSEQWIAQALADSQQNPQVLSMMEILKDEMVEEEIVEGMEEEKHQKEEETGKILQDGTAHQGTDLNEADNDHEQAEYDEHVWLSLKHAQTMVKEISQTIQTIDEKNSSQYEENAAAYLKQLEELDKAYQYMTENAKRKTILFGDRFPFRYLAADYGLTYYAAFPGCSSESEASFETIVFLAEKVHDEKLPCILTIDGSDGSIANAIAENVGEKAEIQTLNSLQAVSQAQIAEGITYLSAMEKNLEVLAVALE